MAQSLQEPRSSQSSRSSRPESLAELDRYCYYVAGTVGRLLTDLFASRMPSLSQEKYLRLLHLSRGFGIGLQLTNIVRDLREDRAQGREFMPKELLGAPGDSRAGDRPRDEPVAGIDVLMRRAMAYLAHGVEYSRCLPRNCFRIRLFCILPIHLAVRTLGRIQARMGDSLQSEPVRISRREVYALLMVSALAASSNSLIDVSFKWLGDARLTAPEVGAPAMPP